jgi:hypothetical protein
MQSNPDKQGGRVGKNRLANPSSIVIFEINGNGHQIVGDAHDAETYVIDVGNYRTARQLAQASDNLTTVGNNDSRFSPFGAGHLAADAVGLFYALPEQHDTYRQ